MLIIGITMMDCRPGRKIHDCRDRARLDAFLADFAAVSALPRPLGFDGLRMKQLGWEHKRRRFDSEPEYCYLKGEEPHKRIVVELYDNDVRGAPPEVRVHYEVDPAAPTRANRRQPFASRVLRVRRSSFVHSRRTAAFFFRKSAFLRS